MVSTLSPKSWVTRVLSLVLVGVFLLAAPVNAAGLFCRSDPVVILSNGVVMDFGVNISSLPWNVEEVHYELHVPVGVSRVLSLHLPTWLTSKESFAFYDDQPEGQYIITAIVRTRSGVTANLDATLVNLSGGQLLGLYTASGIDDQLLTVVLNL